jgi:branched-subunit amino acid transport protein
VSWTTILLIAVGAYSFKALGLLGLGDRKLPAAAERVLALVPAALLAALVVVDTFSSGRSLVLDARAAGVAAGGTAALLRAPFPAVIAIAALVAAGIRQLGV